MGFFKSLFGGNPNGKIFALDKDHNVYYKGEGVTEIDAAHVAGYFKGFGYFSDTNSIDVQIVSPTAKADALKVNFIVNRPNGIAADVEETFRTMVAGLKDLFPDRSLSGAFVDPQFKESKDL